MTDIFFVSTTHHYQPYDDFFKLAMLSGFHICHSDQIDYDNPAHTYITHHFSALSLNKSLTRPRAQIILWQTEFIEVGRYVDYPAYIRRWHLDQWQAGVTGSEYVPVGSHPDLAETRDRYHEQYDIALMAYLPHRRSRITDTLRTRYTMAPNAWGQERSLYLNSSRVMLHIHQRDYGYYVPGIRLAICAAHRLPLICEAVNDKGILTDEVLFAPYTMLAESVDNWLKPIAESALKGYGERLYQTLCVEQTFEKVVKGNV